MIHRSLSISVSSCPPSIETGADAVSPDSTRTVQRGPEVRQTEGLVALVRVELCVEVVVRMDGRDLPEDHCRSSELVLAAFLPVLEI